MVSASAWSRLSDEGRATRRADGPALVSDMTFMRGEQPFDVTALSVPAVFGMGGEASGVHHRRTVRWLGEHVVGAEVYEISGASHGAHLSHPDHFATFVRRVLSRGVGRGLGRRERRQAAVGHRGLDLVVAEMLDAPRQEVLVLGPLALALEPRDER